MREGEGPARATRRAARILPESARRAGGAFVEIDGKAPRIVEFVDALPKSGSGKILWRQLQEQEAAREAAQGERKA
ncbi:hypothetical protein C5O80_09490 [Burkholderia sp. SRS-46]|nr:hypothetical protein C5O80_09490 [Burkholderia sp. SRS-46]